MATIFVSALPYRVTDATLRGLFEEFGQIESIAVHADWRDGTFEPYALIDMDNAARAIEELDGLYIGLTRLRVNEYIDEERANVQQQN